MSAKEPTRRRLQALQTRQKIFDTALALLVKKGYDRVTVDDICASAGVSKGTFYHHYHSYWPGGPWQPGTPFHGADSRVIVTDPGLPGYFFSDVRPFLHYDEELTLCHLFTALFTAGATFPVRFCCIAGAPRNTA